MQKIPLYYSIVITVLAQFTLAMHAQDSDLNNQNIAEEIYTACLGKKEGEGCSYTYYGVPGTGTCQTRGGHFTGFEMNKAGTAYITHKYKNPRLCIGNNS